MKRNILIGILMALCVTAAGAQSLQARPIRFIVPYPPGGGGDTISRLVAQKLAETAGVAVIVENRPGAGGLIGTDLAAKAAGDGYTLVMGTPSPLTVAPTLNKKMPYDPARDLAPVTLITMLPAVVLVNPTLPVKNIAELIVFARAKPGQVNYGSSGNGGTGHLAGLMLQNMANLDMVHVPYKGTGPAVTALLGGEINVMISDMTAGLPLVKAGRLRALAVTSAKRSAALPDVPSVAETIPGYAAGPFYGILAPGSTPRDIVAKRREELVRALNSPEIKSRIEHDGGEIMASTPDEFSALMKAETARWAVVLKEAKFQVE
jgi:tripartite-type tricarboxylate transporter receptor subunit TctC